MFHKFAKSARLNQTGTLSFVHVLEREDSDGVVKVSHQRVLFTRDLQPQIPPVSNFSLDNQLKAGIDLKPVNTKVLQPSEATVDAHAVELVNQLNENEVSNLTTEDL